MAIIRICDICKKPGTDENFQTMTVKDRKGYHYYDFGMEIGAKRKFTIDICDECLDAFKALRQEKLISPVKELGD